MTTFDKREQAYETKFARDEELAFRVKARAHKLLGLWAAGCMGKAGAAAESYARELVMADFEHSAGGDIISRLLKDFAAAGVKTTEKDLQKQMELSLREARSQLGGE